MAKKKTIPQRLNEIEAKLDKLGERPMYIVGIDPASGEDETMVSWYERQQDKHLKQWKEDVVKMATYYRFGDRPEPKPTVPFWGWFKSVHSEDTFRRLIRVTGHSSDSFYFIDLENSANDPLDCDGPTWRKDLLVCLATEYEIKNHLVTEVKKRYNVMDSIISAESGRKLTIGEFDENYFNYTLERDGLCWGTPCVYLKGKWAEKAKPEPIYVPKEIGINTSRLGALIFKDKRSRLYYSYNENAWVVNNCRMGFSNFNTGSNFQILSEGKFIEVGELVFFGLAADSLSSRSDIFNYGFYLGDGEIVHIAGKTVEWDYEPKNQIRKVERV